jgi:hypothetical protein
MSEGVSNRIYSMIDDDGNKRLDFVEFFTYIFMMIFGEKEQKIRFIYGFICHSEATQRESKIAFKPNDKAKEKIHLKFKKKVENTIIPNIHTREEHFVKSERNGFTREDLLEFYLLINQDSRSKGEATVANAEIMANTVYAVLDVNKDRVISFEEFRQFLARDPANIDFFNFVNGTKQSALKELRSDKRLLELIEESRKTKILLNKLGRLIFKDEILEYEEDKYIEAFSKALEQNLKNSPYLKENSEADQFMRRHRRRVDLTAIIDSYITSQESDSKKSKTKTNSSFPDDLRIRGVETIFSNQLYAAFETHFKVKTKKSCDCHINLSLPNKISHKVSQNIEQVDEGKSMSDKMSNSIPTFANETRENELNMQLRFHTTGASKGKTQNRYQRFLNFAQSITRPEFLEKNDIQGESFGHKKLPVVAINRISKNKGTENYSEIKEIPDITLCHVDQRSIPENGAVIPTIGEYNIANRIFQYFAKTQSQVAKLERMIIEEKSKASNSLLTSQALIQQAKSKSRAGSKRNFFFKDQNWNIVTTMLVGMKSSCSFTSDDHHHTLSEIDFQLQNIFGIEAVYKNYFTHCRFTDFAPYVFSEMRGLFGIRHDEYMNSIGLNNFSSAFYDKLLLMLYEQSSGKSGSFFFYSHDDKYLIKTIHRDECKKFLKILPQYHKYFSEADQNKQRSLLSRFYGMHRIECLKNETTAFDVHVIVMNNVLHTPYGEIGVKYDLKGSTYKRLTTEKEIGNKAALKDLNFIDERSRNPNFGFHVGRENREELISQIRRDTNFLQAHNIIDYSLMVGVIEHESSITNLKNISKGDTIVLDDIDGRRKFCIGIIDTLTNFGAKKRGEFILKRTVFGGGVSAVPPRGYANRFINFIEAIFN